MLSPLDQTSLMVAFFGVVSGLLMYYSLNLANRMYDFKKDKKEKRNAIKNSIETQKVLPLVSNIFVMMLPKMKVDYDELKTKADTLEETLENKSDVVLDDVVPSNIEEDLESIIFNKENWLKLDSKIKNLEETINKLSEVDEVFDKYLSYMTHFSRLLFVLTIIVATVIPIYVLGNFIYWVIWGIAIMQVSICLIILRIYAAKASSELEEYEDSYLW